MLSKGSHTEKSTDDDLHINSKTGKTNLWYRRPDRGDMQGVRRTSRGLVLSLFSSGCSLCGCLHTQNLIKLYFQDLSYHMYCILIKMAIKSKIKPYRNPILIRCDNADIQQGKIKSKGLSKHTFIFSLR